MQDNTVKNEEYLKECTKLFKLARDECLKPGRTMIMQDWAEAEDVYWAALGTAMNACKAYRIYRTKNIIQEEELDEVWREEITLTNDEEMIDLLNSILNTEDEAKNRKITRAKAKVCLKKADLIMNGLLNMIPPHIRIQIGC